jgi:hypothetical protein
VPPICIPVPAGLVTIVPQTVLVTRYTNRWHFNHFVLNAGTVECPDGHGFIGLFEVVDLSVVEAIVVSDFVPERVFDLFFEVGERVGPATERPFEKCDFIRE